jgi:hypothetical protein
MSTQGFAGNQRPTFNPEPMVNKLSAMFRQATKGLPWNSKALRDLQITFTYFVDEIQRGPVYDASKMSVFVLHWVQKVEATIKDPQGDLNPLINTQYEHQNFYI